MEKPACGVPTSQVVQGFPVAGEAAKRTAFEDIFGEQVLTKQGLKPTEEVLAGKSAIAIYFSAHGCKACRKVTPAIAGMYAKAWKDNGNEVVFLSSDPDSTSFKKSFAKMPWVALPYEKRELQEELRSKYKVKALPCLVVLGPDGNVMKNESRQARSKDPRGETCVGKPCLSKSVQKK